MSEKRRAGRLFLGTLAVLFAVTVGWRSAIGDDEIQAHLDAGEFAPARRLAERVDDRSGRDVLLARVATAQIAAGDRIASLATIGLISDDRARLASLQAMPDAPGSERGAAGGVQADFDSLIDLITSTVAPTSWDEVGGNGSIAPYEGGVRVDADGVLRRVERKSSARLTAVVLAERARLVDSDAADVADVRRSSQLRKISLTRLERAVQLARAAGRSPSEEMRLLAGLEKIRYVLVYPETGDLVLAGPAGDWKPSVEGRMVSVTSGRPVVQLEDWLVISRYLAGQDGATFGCSITPTGEGLARTRAFAEESSKTPLKPDGRDRWLRKLRERLGRQTIEVFGLDPRTRAAQVLVEADYRMKLVGMGLEEGTVGVTSYLDAIKVQPGQAPPPMDALRWWFTMNYDALISTPDRDGYEIVGQGVRVQCENELVNTRGERIHTGKASALNQEFAQSFTEYFARLAKKYPVYADMQNLFDLALMTALVKNEDLADRVGWHALYFGDEQASPVALGIAPKEVDTVMNHRIINDRYVVVGVSGGVRVDPWSIADRKSMRTDTYGKLRAERATATPPKNLELERWWWD